MVAGNFSTLRLLVGNKFHQLSLYLTVWNQIRLLFSWTQIRLLFSSMPKSVIDVIIYIQQMVAADNIFRCIFFVADKGF